MSYVSDGPTIRTTLYYDLLYNLSRFLLFYNAHIYCVLTSYRIIRVLNYTENTNETISNTKLVLMNIWTMINSYGKTFENRSKQIYIAINSYIYIYRDFKTFAKQKLVCNITRFRSSGSSSFNWIVFRYYYNCMKTYKND